MTSHSESFCRDRRLYDVRRGVVYLRRTDDLAQRQWRHYGAVPAIKTHVIRDIGITTVLPDVSMSQSDVTLEDSGADLRDIDSGLAAGEESESVRKEEDVSLHVSTQEKPVPRLVKPIISITTISRNEHILSSSPEPPKMVVSMPLPPVYATKTSTSPQKPGYPNSKSPSPISGMSTGTKSEQLSRSLVFSRDTAHSSNFPASPPFATSKEERHLMREAQSQSLTADEYVLRESQTHSLAGSSQMTPSDFNLWGSRDWEVSADRMEPLQPKNYAPKHYVPMSRVVGAGVDRKELRKRQLRTMTDFRSRNGTIRIIRPAAPSIDTKRTPGPSGRDDDDDEGFDMDALDREKTYAMLKRIDRLLDPTRAFFNSDLTSSQREVCSSTPTTSSISDPNRPEPAPGQSYRDMILNQRPSHNPRSRIPPVPQTKASKGETRQSQISHLHEPHSHTIRNRGGVGIGAGVGSGGATLAEVMRRLENKGMDLHQKCQDWIKKCFGTAAVTQRGS